MRVGRLKHPVKSGATPRGRLLGLLARVPKKRWFQSHLQNQSLEMRLPDATALSSHHEALRAVTLSLPESEVRAANRCRLLLPGLVNACQWTKLMVGRLNGNSMLPELGPLVIKPCNTVTRRARSPNWLLRLENTGSVTVSTQARLGVSSEH